MRIMKEALMAEILYNIKHRVVFFNVVGNKKNQN